MPAAAMMRPWRVSTILVTPPGWTRSATIRTVSCVIAFSRSATGTCMPSALETILLVITRMSPSRRAASASSATVASMAAAIRATRSSPAPISGRPGMPQTV
ncbi:hypothetical protein D3C86_2000850 [compost metagenome]